MTAKYEWLDAVAESGLTIKGKMYAIILGGFWKEDGPGTNLFVDSKIVMKRGSMSARSVTRAAEELVTAGYLELSTRSTFNRAPRYNAITPERVVTETISCSAYSQPDYSLSSQWLQGPVTVATRTSHSGEGVLRSLDEVRTDSREQDDDEWLPPSSEVQNILDGSNDEPSPSPSIPEEIPPVNATETVYVDCDGCLTQIDKMSLTARMGRIIYKAPLCETCYAEMTD